jgi:hypothetical protein
MPHDVFETVLRAWAAAFALSLIIEVPIFALVARREVPVWRAALAGAAGTFVTHPLLWFAWVHVVHDYTLYIASGEVLVAAIETLTFWALARPVSLRTALAASLVANGASYGAGLILDRLGS